MNDLEKIKFILCTIKSEIPYYVSGKREYTKQDEWWLDKYLTKSNFGDIVKNDIESAYKVALNIHNER